MSTDRRGIEALRDAIEKVAVDLERDGALQTRLSGSRRTSSMAAAVLAVAATIAAVGAVWLALPRTRPEVEVLQLKIQGRPVRAVVVGDRAPGTVVVLPDERKHTRERSSVAAGFALIMGER